MSRSAATGEGNLHLAVESELPAELEVGRGNVLAVYGWCFHSRHRIRRLDMLLDGVPQPLIAYGMPRPDVLHELTDAPRAPELVYRSGFWGLLRLPAVSAAREAEISLRAKLDRGETAIRRAGSLRLAPGFDRRWARLDGGSPKVAICMATFNPPEELFRQQVESILAQTHEDWVCVISDDASRPESLALIEELTGDDPRFQVHTRQPRLGYYRNFERALTLVPPEAELVALSDQDDHWHEDKLASLVERIAGDVTLAYSDMRVTDGEGETLSETFWTEREYNDDDLGGMLLNNSVTGGSALFRSEILEYVLPFPTPPEGGLHDHWIAMVAMALGEVAYVDRPLYDYVQHGAAALGHESLRRPRLLKGPGLRNVLRSGPAFRAAIARRLAALRSCYPTLLGVRTSAELLLLRGGKRIDRRKRRVLRRWARIERSPPRWAWLVYRARSSRSQTLGTERMLVAGSLWRAVLEAVKMLRLPPPPPGRETLSNMLKLPLASDPPVAARLQRRIAPLALEEAAGAPERVNLLISKIELDRVEDSLRELQLARKLAEAGERVRVVTVDEPFYLPPSWREDLGRVEGMDGLLSAIEIELAHDRSTPIEVSAADRFVASNWWTAQLAHRAGAETGQDRFLYLIPEYEPLALPMGSEAALARQSYELPHAALFCGELLREYFRVHGLGVFGRAGGGDDASAVFDDAIYSIASPAAEEMTGTERKLLFHVRADLKGEQSLYELGLIALAESLQEGTLEGWVVNGVGPRQPTEVRHGDRLRVKVLAADDRAKYAALLRGHAVGVSLMLSPTPGRVPLEMAAAGMPVVTTTFENKTADALTAISENLIGIEPTVEAIKDGIRQAVAASADHARRARGSEIGCARSWEESFDPELIARLRGLLRG